MPEFVTIHTNAGLSAIVAAESSGVPLELTHMAVGDGNGNPVLPVATQGSLVRERYRAPVNRVFQSPADPHRFIAEMIIPASEGGFTLREVGIFDAEGSLFAVGNLPDTYKPADGEGAFADTVVRLEFMLLNAEAVAVQVDANVAVATQSWVSNNVTAEIVLPGGTTGQILTKLSNADGDCDWQDPGEFSATVVTTEERQGLSAGQTAVLLANVTTDGLALYIDGIRLGGDEWTPDPVDPAALELAVAATGGETLIAVQNDPAGPLVVPLEKSQNLADVPNKATARSNLGVYSKAEARQFAPAGMVAYFAQWAPPGGWLVANGAAVSRTAYADLYAAIGDRYGAGDGFTSFNLPDLRGEFIRGFDGSRGIDQGRELGSAQSDDFKAHTHNLVSTIKNGDLLSPTNQIARETAAGGDTEYHLRGTSSAATLGKSSATGGTETRPRNIAMQPCIKY